MTSRSLIAVVAISNTSTISYYTRKAGASFSVMQSILALASFFTAIAFYFLYNERLYLRHLAGMLCLIICLVFLAISKQLTFTESQQYKDLVASGEEIQPLWIPIAFTFLQCFYYVVASVQLRTAISNKYPAMQFSIDFQLLTGVVFLIGFCHQTLINDRPYSLFLIIYIAIAGLAIFGALTFLNLALKYGKGGLAVAISQTNSCIILLFEIVFEQRMPNIYEVLSIAFAMIGGMIIAIVK